ncbi:5-bromo-4-chloroindolyl phosphate hydrolysis family protein [Planococcus sp. ISL-110]|uniref:5-bromo-4-chloroindolyl phosphate hydrolysis family protein n=1 Tax=Planococcus sp. ISL-110 TaxID=2819167 RepID=UPI001BE95179|nr:5-bromo-4-chloroindolyl phosphate hydrolysis family protein [Planococcus sp. ISL-110]MBT2571439.1 5-bromo-4-chloroindolyl phosphate hydrolysis family protein [Planococcus sp. ISL-110]
MKPLKPIENFIKRQSVSLPLMTVMFPVLYLGAEIGLIASGAVAAGTYIASNSTIKQVQISSDSKNLGMTRSEFKNVRNQIKEGKEKIKQLQGNYYKVRSISSFKQLMDMTKIANKIIIVVQQNPRKFYLAEPFFYSHLDSAIELTEKYTLLVGQPVKDREMRVALQDTREMLLSLNKVMEQDLKRVLSSDVEKLRMELDYAQLAVNQHNDQKLLVQPEPEHEGDVEDDRETINTK